MIKNIQHIYTEEDNIEKNKRALRQKAQNYEIDKNGYICFKISDNKVKDKDSLVRSFDSNNNNKNNHCNLNDKIDIKFSKKDLLKTGLYTLYLIPYKIGEYKLIRDIHENINHRNWKDTHKEMKRQRYYYCRYVNNIKYVISK